MRLLLDTHAVAWWWTDDARLSGAARAAITDPRNAVAVSAVSAWEFAVKHRAGRWAEAGDIVDRWDALIAGSGFVELAVTATHALRAGGLDWTHRDPFDRLLAAQAAIEGMRLVTVDVQLRGFVAEIFWPR